MSNRAPRKTGYGPFLMIAGGVILILVLILVELLSNTPTAPVQATLANAVSPIAVPRVSLADAFQAYNQKTAVFVDVRDTDSYALGHIPGAINIPLADLDARSGELSAQKWIITYCT